MEECWILLLTSGLFTSLLIAPIHTQSCHLFLWILCWTPHLPCKDDLHVLAYGLVPSSLFPYSLVPFYDDSSLSIL